MKTLASRLEFVKSLNNDNKISKEGLEVVKDLIESFSPPELFIAVENINGIMSDAVRFEEPSIKSLNSVHTMLLNVENSSVSRLEVLRIVFSKIELLAKHWSSRQLDVLHFNSTLLSELYEVQEIYEFWDDSIDFNNMIKLLKDSVITNRAAMGLALVQLTQKLEVFLHSLLKAIYGDLSLNKALKLAEKKYGIPVKKVKNYLYGLSFRDYADIYGNIRKD